MELVAIERTFNREAACRLLLEVDEETSSLVTAMLASEIASNRNFSVDCDRVISCVRIFLVLVPTTTGKLSLNWRSITEGFSPNP